MSEIANTTSEKKYHVVCLCGSTSFDREFRRTFERLTLEGNIVLTIAPFFRAHMKRDFAPDVLNMFQNMHLQRIDMADEIYVVNPRGYIGESTAKEIEYAKSIGKPISYLVDPDKQPTRNNTTQG